MVVRMLVYSVGRDAYVLRAIGNRRGPVLVVRREHLGASQPSE